MRKLYFLFLIIASFLNAQYAIESIDYEPVSLSETVNVYLEADDQFSEVIEIPFGFEFFGEEFDAITIGSNGIVSFNIENALGICNYFLEAPFPNPELDDAFNAIMLYNDMFPGASNSLETTGVYYKVTGTEPNRFFSVIFYDIPQYGAGCETSYTSFEVKLFESSNIIEMHILNKPECSSWNDGNSAIAIQNADGTVAFVPEGRNVSLWSAQEEAWRFVPGDGQAEIEFEYCWGENSDFPIINLYDAFASEYDLAEQNTVLFYSTLVDAESQTNPLPNANAYQVSEEEEVVYAVITGDEIGEFVIVEFKLKAEDCDEDNDGVLDEDEDVNEDGNYDNDDTDGDGTPNYLDSDDDGDSVPTEQEVQDNQDARHTFIDTDGDGIENYLDNDDDGDGTLTIDEDWNENGTLLDDDLNENGIPDYLDNAVTTLSVNDVSSVQEIKLYPNPTKNYVNIEGLELMSNVRLLNTHGKLIKKIESQNQISVQNLPNGVYILVYEIEGVLKSQKIIKK